MGKLTDDLLHVYKASITHTTDSDTTPISEEIDLELPRGYVAKIREVIMQVIVAANWTDGDEARLRAALVRDPDDVATVAIPEHTVQHDVIADMDVDIVSTAATMGLISPNAYKQVNFEQMKGDYITARNMRWNSQSNGDVGAAYAISVEIYYTLEKVTKNEILELLDIL